MADRTKLAECRSCHAPIRFVKLASGKAMPVNPTPNAGGNVSAHRVGGQLHGHVISREHPARPGDTRYVAHYATCEERKPRPATPKRPEDVPLW